MRFAVCSVPHRAGWSIDHVRDVLVPVLLPSSLLQLQLLCLLLRPPPQHSMPRDTPPSITLQHAPEAHRNVLQHTTYAQCNTLQHSTLAHCFHSQDLSVPADSQMPSSALIPEDRCAKGAPELTLWTGKGMRAHNALPLGPQSRPPFGRENFKEKSRQTHQLCFCFPELLCRSAIHKHSHTEQREQGGDRTSGPGS